MNQTQLNLVVVLLTRQGTARYETMLRGVEDTPENRADIEKCFCLGFPDSPIPGTWTDVSNSTALAGREAYNVTLPWNPNNSDEGTYGTTVWACSDDEAVLRCAAEMADSGEKHFDDDVERNDYIKALLDDGGDVVTVANDLRYNLQVAYRKQLFPDGVARSIDLEKLGEVLQENRTRIVVSVDGKQIDDASRNKPAPEALFDNNQADSEGWSLFESDGRLQLQRCDEAAVFASDADAIIHVSKRASAGSAYHYEALQLIGTLAE